MECRETEIVRGDVTGVVTGAGLVVTRDFSRTVPAPDLTDTGNGRGAPIDAPPPIG